jgi:outer membrane protein, heavy metal efflux system
MTHLRVFAVLLLASAFARAAEPTLSLEQVLLRARDNNPEIAAARRAWESKRARVRPAGTWPNPTLKYIDEKEPRGMEGEEPMGMRTYAIEQMIPFPGKLTAESRMQGHEVLIAETAYRDKIFDVLKSVRLRYYELYMADQRIALAEESVGILQSSLRSAQNRVASSSRARSDSTDMSGNPMGGGSIPSGNSAADIFMVQTELRKMENMLYEEKQRRQILQVELNSLLNQDTETPWESVQAPELKDIPVTLADLKKVARENAPLYMTAMHEKNHSQAMLTRSRLEFAPDFGVMYGKKVADQGPDGRELAFSLSVPLWLQRPLGQQREAKRHVEEANANAQAMQNMVMKMVHMEFVELQTHLTLTRNYMQSILPPAQSNLTISRNRYASGQTDFLRFLEAFRSWIDAHMQYEEHLYHYGEHWAELERWVGVELAQTPLTLQHMRLGVTGEKRAH